MFNLFVFRLKGKDRPDDKTEVRTNARYGMEQKRSDVVLLFALVLFMTETVSDEEMVK